MTASIESKKAGIPLTEVSRRLGVKESGFPEVSTTTLQSWFDNKPGLWKAVLFAVTSEEFNHGIEN